MQLRLSQPAFLASLFLLFLSWAAQGAVNLTIDGGLVTQTSVTVAPNGTFPVTVRLFSGSSNGADGVIGIDYFLKASTPSVFTLNSRSSTGSVFVPTAADGAVAGSLLIPENNTDLGGNTSDPFNGASNGTFFVASFVIGVSPATPGGKYTLSVSDNASGFANANFGLGTYNALGSFTVNVTPEPSALALVLGLPLLAARRRV